MQLSPRLGISLRAQRDAQGKQAGVGYWLLVIGYWLLVTGYEECGRCGGCPCSRSGDFSRRAQRDAHGKQAGVGYWLLVFGYWLLVMRNAVGAAGARAPGAATSVAVRSGMRMGSRASAPPLWLARFARRWGHRRPGRSREPIGLPVHRTGSVPWPPMRCGRLGEPSLPGPFVRCPCVAHTGSCGHRQEPFSERSVPWPPMRCGRLGEPSLPGPFVRCPCVAHTGRDRSPNGPLPMRRGRRDGPALRRRMPHALCRMLFRRATDN